MQLPPLRTSFLRAALVFAGKKDVRYYLNGVCVEVTPAGLYIVATDGVRMLAAHDGCAGLIAPDGKHKQWIIPGPALEAFLKTTKQDSVTFTPADDDKTGTLTDGATTVQVSLLEGRFPEWRRVIPQGELAGPVAQFPPEQIADLAKVSKLLGKPKATFAPPAIIEHNGPKPARLTWPTAEHGANVVAVVMPLTAPLPPCSTAWAHAA